MEGKDVERKMILKRILQEEDGMRGMDSYYLGHALVDVQ